MNRALQFYGSARSNDEEFWRCGLSAADKESLEKKRRGIKKKLEEQERLGDELKNQLEAAQKRQKLLRQI